MQASFDPTYSFTLGVEKATRSTVRTDPGNWTGGQMYAGNFIGSQCGVSAPVLGEWLGRTATLADMEAVTPDTMRAIFGQNNWLRSNGDSLPVGADLMTVDHGYNRGPVTAVRLTQRVAGVDQDGWAGPQTVAALTGWTIDKLDLSFLDTRALQKAAGVSQDGSFGPVTHNALAGVQSPVLAVLYAAQVHDYRSLAAASQNSGWFTRALARYTAALKLLEPSA